VMGLDAESAGKHVPFYWGGALIGRFLGSGILRVASPGKVLAAFATGSIALILISANSTGALSGWTLLAIGLCNSIMFPTIFTLASAGLGARAAEGSGVLATAIVGGGVIPPLTGQVADSLGLHAALALPACCYIIIAGFGFALRSRSRPARA
jgi:MFS transporter, FHS family, L-fucose permease